MKKTDTEEIYLKIPGEKELEGNWHDWLNDLDVTKYQNKGIFYNTREKQREYCNKMANSENDVLFAIIDKETDTHIGCVGLHNIDWVHRSANLGIIIGEKRFWDRGYGKKAWNMITYHGLFVLNLHRIYADVMVENVASIICAEYSGFRREGVVLDKYFKNGEYHDAVMLSVLKKEFIKV